MISISDKPNKRLEYFSGTLTMAVPYSEHETWEFTVIKTTNGVTSHDVEVDTKQILESLSDEDRNSPSYETIVEMISKLIQKTVIANIKTQKALWQPTEK